MFVHMHRTLALAASRRWRAVLSRDARSDGTFVYAVRSTGIFCRPSCPARRPARAHVVFFDDAAGAAAAGFRACRRCDPQGPQDREASLVRDACRLIEADGARPSPLAGLARRLAVPEDRLRRAFQTVLGVTPRQYAAQRRLESLKAALRSGRRVGPALYAAGYGSARGVYERAGSRLGMTPATYGRGGRGADIRYAVTRSELGLLLVATTARGLCQVALGARRTELVQGLRQEFPAARLRPDARSLARTLASIGAHLAGRLATVDLPLDVRGTAFQWQVWRALQEIPYGSTRSYRAIAQAIGNPRATRAVARACASNPVALVIPCHRVVRSDGTPGGYRWGVRRKRALLRAEIRRAPATRR